MLPALFLWLSTSAKNTPKSSFTLYVGHRVRQWMTMGTEDSSRYLILDLKCEIISFSMFCQLIWFYIIPPLLTLLLVSFVQYVTWICHFLCSSIHRFIVGHTSHFVHTQARNLVLGRLIPGVTERWGLCKQKRSL